jgi:glucosamine-6-phosphate deaminase
VKPPRLLIEPTYEAMSARAAALIDEAVRAEPELVLALPTGVTPIGTYAALAALHRRQQTDWSQVTVFNLDEYVGVGPDHPHSYAAFMDRHLFQHLNVPRERRHIANGLATDPEAECARYEAEIDRAGGVGLAVLGIGTNGHLGFNEPADALVATTHVATLTDDTWRRNFPEMSNGPMADRPPGERPFDRSYTMGIGTILRARRVLLLASGGAKRHVVIEALGGPITTRNPASLLQLHRDVTLVLDRAAAP